MDATKPSYFGKYREIVLAVAFFLIFDLAVLGLNFYISYSISQDAVAINLAGRQRMLSQRISKTVLALEQDVQDGKPLGNGQAELGAALKLFDQTLLAFETGGSVSGGAGLPVTLSAVSDPKGRSILQSAHDAWTPLRNQLQPIVLGTPALEAVHAASLLIRAHNVALLDQMNQLTTRLEMVANSKAENLRLVQTGGIVLALLNFVFILFKFIRRMQSGDRLTEEARQETSEILETVGEGLLLLDSNFIIGSQYSRSLPQILGCAIQPGQNFLDILQQRLPATNFAAARSYISLLFGYRVKEALVAELNPLTEVPVTHPADPLNIRHIRILFKRAWVNGKISHLLVTIQDVSEQVALRHEIKSARQQVKLEVEILLDMLKVHPGQLAGFLESTREVLQTANENLRELSGEQPVYRRLIINLFRRIHTVKGDAGALGLALFERMAHEFEAQLETLREKPDLNGDDCLGLLPHLDAFFTRLEQVQLLLGRIRHLAPSEEDVMDASLETQLQSLAQRIASDHGKQVDLTLKLAPLATFAETQRKAVQDILIQLVRNAVVHGIEAPDERTRQGKTAAGALTIALEKSESGDFELRVQDDGAGIVPLKLRQTLIQSGRYHPEQLAELDDRQVVMKIFEPGISTASDVSRDAGRGMGMAVVKQQVSQLGGHLRLASRPGNFTLFTVRFAA